MTDITIAQAGTWPTYRLTLTRRWRDALLEAGL
jgi:hypothetical protein